MALGDRNQDEVENPPVSIVAPGDFNPDLSTMRFDPIEYLRMAGEGLGSLFSGPSAPREPEYKESFVTRWTPEQYQESQAMPYGEDYTSQMGGPSIPPADDTFKPDPESHPLLTAIDSGYADKKVMNPVEELRKGILSGDQKVIEKSQRKLVDALTGGMTFGERFQDTYFRQGKLATVHKMAADVIMNEFLRPQAEEATRTGLISPNELLPGSQTQETLGSIPPQGPFAFTPEGVNVDTSQLAPAMTPQTKVLPDARLTPLQQEIAGSRQKALSTGLAYKAALAKSKEELNAEKVLTERFKRDVEGPAKVKALESLNSLREAQANLADARVDWYKQLPGLRRELAGSPALEIDAMKRVHQAILEKKPIEKADWLIAERWLRKGSPRFSVDFMGRAFDRLTGQSERKAGPFGWTGLPEPPSTLLDEGQQAEAEHTDQDLISQFGNYIGSLLKGIAGGGKEEEPKAEPKVPGLTKEEQAELEKLRKKHGKQ